MAVYKRISSGNLMRWCFFNLLHLLLLANEVSLQKTVEGFIGESAILPCSSTKPPLIIKDLFKNYQVRWRNKYDLHVYDIINGNVSVEEPDSEYKDRVESFPEEYVRGNFSIKLNNIQHTDAEKYTCYIMEELEDQTVELQIKERSERQLPSEGTKPKPELIVMFISVLCICIIFSLTNSAAASF